MTSVPLLPIRTERLVLRPFTAEDEQFVAISRDVTDRVKAVEAKDALLRQQDLLMREVDHRAKK